MFGGSFIYFSKCNVCVDFSCLCYCWSRYTFKWVKKKEKVVELWDQALIVWLAKPKEHQFSFCPCTQFFVPPAIWTIGFYYPDSSKSRQQPIRMPSKFKLSRDTKAFGCCLQNCSYFMFPWSHFFNGDFRMVNLIFLFTNINLGMLTQLHRSGILDVFWKKPVSIHK